MSEPRGPKVDVPEDLALALEGASGPEAGESEPAEAPAAESPESGTEGGGEGEALSALQALELELAETRDRYLRLAAEFENFKRRALRERQELYTYANENLVKELLATVDNLDRALGHAQQVGEVIDSAALLEGVELTRRSLLQTLERFGTEQVLAAGQPFDPQVHEAVRQVPTTEVEPGQVVEVHQEGYRLKDRLLRPALVAVSCRPASETVES